MVRYMKTVLQDLLLDNSESVIVTVFSRIAPLTKLKMLHEGLKLFMTHFILRKKALDSEDYSRLKESIATAERALSKGHNPILL